MFTECLLGDYGDGEVIDVRFCMEHWVHLYEYYLKPKIKKHMF